MLMHTKGILVMTPDSAMVLTGKHSLDYSGGVSAEDNFGIGGYDRVMGPNGQAQYWAPNLSAAVELLFQHYDHAYVAPGERWARPAETSDPRDRDVRTFPHSHPSSEFTTVGDVFSVDGQPGPEEAVRHPHGHAGGHRPGPRGARAVGRHGRRRHHGRARRPPRRAPGHGAGHRVAADPAARQLPDRRARTSGRRGRCSRGRRRRRRGRSTRLQRQPAAGGAGQPVGLRRVTGVAAERAAGVRGGDRPGDRQLRRPDRLLRHLPVPRRRLRRVLRRAERQHGGAGGRGLLRLGARRCAGGRGGVHRRGRQADGGAIPGCASWRPRSRLPRASTQAHLRVELAALREQRALGEAR